MRQREEQHIGGAVGTQVVEDGVDALHPEIDPGLDLLEEGDDVGSCAALSGPRPGGSGCRLEGAKDIATAAAAVIDLLRAPLGWALRWMRVWPAKLFAASRPISSRQTTTLVAGGLV